MIVADAIFYDRISDFVYICWSQIDQKTKIITLNMINSNAIAKLK